MATVTAQRLHPTVELSYAKHIKTIWNMGLSENVRYIPNEIAI